MVKKSLMQMQFTPSHTPPSLKVLLGAIFTASVLSSFIGPYLILTHAGIHHLYLWQFATYVLIHPFPSTLIHLAFNLYLIWTFGTILIGRLHSKLFFSLFFGSAITAGLFAWVAMATFPLSSSFLMGSSTALYGLLMSWVILNPDAHLLLFFTIPFKARHLALGLIGINLIIDLSRSDWVSCFAYIGAILFSYLFTLIACRMRSPFPFLSQFENSILRFIEWITHFSSKLPICHTKIYDIKSGEPILNDDQFMDAMLSQISLYGENSLKPEEKARMKRISERKTPRKK